MNLLNNSGKGLTIRKREGTPTLIIWTSKSTGGSKTCLNAIKRKTEGKKKACMGVFWTKEGGEGLKPSWESNRPVIEALGIEDKEK